MMGMTASSANLSDVNWDAIFVKTVVEISIGPYVRIEVIAILRHGVNSITLRLATNFCESASKRPCRATIYPGRLTHTTSSTASKTSKTR